MYHVNGSVTSLEITFGGPLPVAPMRTTLTACRSSIARAMYREGGFQYITPDPYVFPDDDGKGLYTQTPALKLISPTNLCSFLEPYTLSLKYCYSLTLPVCVIDPRDRRYRGAEIEIHSTGAEKLGGLTWWQLDAVVKGLQEAMLQEGIYREARFKIFDGLTKAPEQGVGRLTGVRKRPNLVDANVTWL